jgi:hypothetical protein
MHMNRALIGGKHKEALQQFWLASQVTDNLFAG